jgi:hypothetical protein
MLMRPGKVERYVKSDRLGEIWEETQFSKLRKGDIFRTPGNIANNTWYRAASDARFAPKLVVFDEIGRYAIEVE